MMSRDSERPLSPYDAWSGGRKLRHGRLRVKPWESFAGEFEGIAMSFPMADLEPEIQRLLKPKGYGSEDALC